MAMLRCRVAALVLVTLGPAAVPAQAPADFSGRWTLEAPAIATTPAVPGTPASAAAPGDLGSGWGAALTIVQDAKQMSVEYSVFSRYDLQPPLKFVYPLDGSEGRQTLTMGLGPQVQSSRARWDGQSLIVVTTFHVTDRHVGRPFTSEMTRKLRLESPATLIVDVHRGGVLGGPPSTTRSVYRKQPSS